MRHVVRHLPAYLGLLLPLGAIAWFGSVEIVRQEERAERALAGHAETFLRDAGRALEREVETRAHVAREPIAIALEPLVVVDERVADENPLARGLLLLDAGGELIHPDAAPRDGLDLPLHRPSASSEVRAAEKLIDVGDFDGARQLLENTLSRGRARRLRSSSRLRARFRLATVLRRLGDFEGAVEHFSEARRPSRGRADPVIALLSDVALAEIDATHTNRFDRVIQVMRGIAEGENHQSIGDTILAETLNYLHDLVPPTADELTTADRALDTDVVRRQGRTFAADFRDFVSGSVRRQIRNTAGDGLVYATHTGDSGASLLALRRISEAESRQLLAVDDSAWIGVRFDLTELLEDALESLIEITPREFYLAIETSEGEPILPREAPPEASIAGFSAPRIRSVAGLVLRAEPSDVAAFLDARSASSRNRTLLIIALCVLAGGGAFMLVRSVARESEIASLKLQLISRVSHELKTPIALIKMYAETIQRGRTTGPEQTAQFTGVIEREADRLTGMVQRILDFSRRESGEHAFEPSDVDLDRLVTDVADAFAPKAEARGTTIETRVEPGVVAYVDHSACESALLNLIENAVKYTEQPGTTVEVSLAVRDGEAVLEVADRGIGIPAREREQVFTSFYRAGNAKEAPGVGLGLNLVRGFARAHGGDVRAFPRDGGGTIMRMTLPLGTPGE